MLGIQACMPNVKDHKPVRLAYKLSMPHIPNMMGFWCLGFGLGHLLGLVFLGPVGPSGIGLIFIYGGTL